MSLTMLRERQKFFLWLVAILVIPSFIILYGLDDRALQEGSGTLYVVKGKAVSYQDYLGMLKRMSMGMRQPIPEYPVLALDGRDTDYQVLQAAATQYLVEFGRERAVTVQDEEVNTFVRRYPLFMGEDGKFSKERMDDMLRNNLSLVQQEFLDGVRDQMVLAKMERMMDHSALASITEAYHLWAMENTRVVYDTVSESTTTHSAAAKEALGDVDEAIAAYVKANPKDPALRGPTRWQLEFIALDYDNARYDKNVTDDDLQTYMDAHAEEYKDKKLDDVRAQVRSFLLRERRIRGARHFMDVTLSTILTDLAANDVVTAADVLANQFASAAQLESGRTDLLTADGIASAARDASGAEPAHAIITGSPMADSMEGMRDPELAKYRLVDYLNYVDRLSGEAREKKLEMLKQNFTSKDGTFAGYFYNARSAFRVRVLDVQPGVEIDWKTDEKLREILTTRLVTEKALALAREALVAKRAIVIKDDPEALKTVVMNSATSAYPARPDALENARVRIPTEILQTADGFSFHVLRAAEVPSLEQFRTLPADKQAMYVNRARFNNNRAYGEHAGPRLTAFLWDAQLDGLFYQPKNQ